MKISPIINLSNNYAEKKVQRQNNISAPKNHTVLENKAYYGQDLVSFKSGIGVDKATKIAKMESLLSGAITRIEVGDFLLVSKTSNMAKKALKMFKDQFNVPIKALGVCQNSDIDETFMLLKGFNSVCRIWNLSNLPLRVNGFETLKYSETIPIEHGDRISLGGNWIKYNGLNMYDAADISEKEFEYFDFHDEVDQVFVKHNDNVIKKLFASEQNINDKKSLSFNDIGGQDDVIKALKRNILFPLKYPEAFEGYKLNKGAILYGPPGTGKTLLARTLGVEANASFFEMCATEMQDMYVGQSEKNCRELFQKAIEAQPSIIFLDEIDALGKNRGSSDVHGDKLLNQFLHSVGDLNDKDDKVFVIGTTNRLEDIDPALLRSLRMGMKLEVKLPDLEGTKQIFKIHSKGKPVDENLDYDKMAQKLFEKKMSGADIALIVKDASSNAFERAGIYKSMDEGRFTSEMLDYFRITEEDFDKAISDFSTGAKKRSPIGYNSNVK